MHSKMYVKLMNSREWREIRTAKLNLNPLCEVCARKGYVRAANTVHHIREVESGKTEQECRQLAFAFANLMSVCREHHHELHNDMRYHSRQAHQERNTERLRQWVARHGGKD